MEGMPFFPNLRVRTSALFAAFFFPAVSLIFRFDVSVALVIVVVVETGLEKADNLLGCCALVDAVTLTTLGIAARGSKLDPDGEIREVFTLLAKER